MTPHDQHVIYLMLTQPSPLYFWYAGVIGAFAMIAWGWVQERRKR